MNEKMCCSKSQQILVSLLCLMIIIALGSYAQLNFEKIKFVDSMPATISVTGEGEVLSIPDVGNFSFSVIVDADDAEEAQELSGTKMNNILSFLRDQGIEDKDMKVQGYNLSPKWRWEDGICSVGVRCPGERVRDGFSVSQTVSVKVRDLDIIGSVVAGVGERQATNISSLSFSVDDVDLLKEEARAKAIVDAKAKAEILAEQLDVQLIRISSYHEDNNGSGSAYRSKAMFLDDMEGESIIFDGPELPAGEESVTARVGVTYEVQ